MPLSQRLSISYPANGADPWYDAFKGFVDGVDQHLFAAMEDRNNLLIGGGEGSWNSDTGVFSWSESIQILTPSTGKLQTIGASSVTVTSGQMIVSTITRGATRAVVLAMSVANYVSSNSNQIVIGYRLGETLYLRTGQRLSNGDTVQVGTGVSYIDIKDKFILDNETWEFELTETPSPSCIPIVDIDGVLTEGYTIVGKSITVTEYPVYVDVDGWVLTVRYRK